ncbi:MAG: hypothetical protein JXQ76_01590 [Campylobacterales bacterium]|nr:hypothetical protein [Campylobacterales bacterium]
MAQIIGTIDTKFKDIFARLYKAQQHRKQLEDNFKEYQSEGINYDKYIEQVDSDMRLLSSHGMNLANVTKRLFATIKPKIIEARMRLDTISGRKETMGGLRSFENELSKVNNMPKDAIDASTAQMVDAINSAIDELERAVAK